MPRMHGKQQGFLHRGAFRNHETRTDNSQVEPVFFNRVSHLWTRATDTSFPFPRQDSRDYNIAFTGS